jgi:tetrahydromethanopterin S-methyltransferase subunit E
LTATLTATSADDGCGRWVVRIVVLAADGVAKGVDGVTLEAESDVGVDAGGDADVGVAEKFLDHNKVNALFQEQGGG